MTAIARDAVAAAHLVYAWPFPIGPECEVACADDEHVVMCPAWLVGERLGPGRHLWRTPDPMRPSTAYFVLTAPVEVPFDMTTAFTIPATGQRVRLHAVGSLQVRCADAQLLIAQFVGLPFDDVNGGILRSVSRSVERMLARLLTRRVVLGASPGVVTDPQNHPAILEELVAYNPAAGAVFGVEMIRMGHLAIEADDGSAPLKPIGQTAQWGRVGSNGAGAPAKRRDDIPLLETVRGRPSSMPPVPRAETAPVLAAAEDKPPEVRRSPSVPPIAPSAITTTPAPGEIKRKATPIMGVAEMAPMTSLGGMPAMTTPSARATPPSGSPVVSSSMSSNASGEIGLPLLRPTEQSMPAMSLAADDPTPPPAIPPTRTPVPGSLRAPTAPPVAAAPPPPAIPPPPLSAVSGEIGGAKNKTAADGLPNRKANGADVTAARGSIMGIGMTAIGEVQGGAAVAGEIPTKVAPGARVLVPGPNGLMQSATVRQLLQGYYELEVGSSGQTIWVPMNGVVPDP